jgi:hypothetical protein
MTGPTLFAFALLIDAQVSPCKGAVVEVARALVVEGCCD